MKMTMGAAGDCSVVNTMVVLLGDCMNRFITARVGCQNDVIWHLTICDLQKEKKNDVITMDSAICSVALCRI